MKTYSAKPTDIKRTWYVIDASEAPLGRIATVAASLLLGKGKPSFTRHMDGGDYVVVINAKNLIVTGNKVNAKSYYSHSGYPGSLRETRLKEKLVSDPTGIIVHAIRGMLPVNKLRPGRLARLKVYAGNEHNHTAQQPVMFSVKRSLKINAKKEDN